MPPWGGGGSYLSVSRPWRDSNLGHATPRQRGTTAFCLTIGPHAPGSVNRKQPNLTYIALLFSFAATFLLTPCSQTAHPKEHIIIITLLCDREIPIRPVMNNEIWEDDFIEVCGSLAKLSKVTASLTNIFSQLGRQPPRPTTENIIYFPTEQKTTSKYKQHYTIFYKPASKQPKILSIL